MTDNVLYKTIEELEIYLEEECFSFNELSIGKHTAFEGIVVKRDGTKYIFGCSERGNLNVIQEFETEEELVAYAFDRLSEDKWMKAHLAAWTWTEEEILEAEVELKNLNIHFERNDVPNYSLSHGRAYRIFVFGKDIKMLTEFTEKHIKIRE